MAISRDILDVGKITEQPPTKDQSEEIGKEEARAIAERLSLDKFREELETIIQDRIERKKYANRAFWIVIGWVGVLSIILFFQGFWGHTGGEGTVQISGVSYKFTKPSLFTLSDTVLVALISGSTLSIFGFFTAVMNYLFPKRKD